MFISEWEKKVERQKRLRPGQAKVQFIACKEEIQALLGKGHSMVETLEILTKEKKLNIGYCSFRNLILEHIYNKPRTKKNKWKQAKNIQETTHQLEKNDTHEEHQVKLISAETQGNMESFSKKNEFDYQKHI